MKVLLIGLGSIAKKHISALRVIDPTISISALRSNRNSAPYLGVEDIYDINDIVFEEYSFAIISNPTSEHAKTVETLIGYNIPLFIEKPIFAELDHEDILKKINDNHIKSYVACDMRFLDCLNYTYDYIHGEGNRRRVNEVNVYCGSYLPDWRPGTDYKRCYSAIPELGGGVHIDLIHDIDYVYWIFGAPLYTQKVFRNNSSIEIKAIDYANYTMVYEQFCTSVILNYYRRDAKRTMEIVFSDGTWLVDMNANQIKDEIGNIVYSSEQSSMDCYIKQLNNFMDSLNNENSKSSNDAFEAYEVLKICLV
ncbi:Gfo/Idh/MocA family protein [Bacteroides ovatus]|uniref:Gfo/Idh/MocA family protein n=1 Tax=Bacteroides ovatus TaxID=28116 RepID=UPI0020306D53|nr:Gfo/Idh/MocA family oxidoreductase [Bacteroides ovatus]MCM1755328.1 Gfo/Idh/MocA family oxidoreductase [Bacteroides ovatus]